MKVLTLAASGVLATAAVLSLSTASYATNDTNDNKDHKITICHATNSATNPYVKITVDTHAVVMNGHGGHDDTVVAISTQKAQELKDAKVKWGDVIPAIPEQNFAGVNWNEEGKALFAHGCGCPTVTPASTTSDKEKDHNDKETPKQSTVTPASTGAASTPAELPQTGASPIASIFGLGSLVTAGSYYLNSRRARQ